MTTLLPTAAQQFYCIMQSDVDNIFAVDFDDHVTGENAGAGRRGIIDRRDDGKHAVFDRDDNTETAEFALVSTCISLKLLVP